MARPRQRLDDSAKDSTRVQSLLKDSKLEAWKKERLIAVNLGLQGELTVEKIAEAVGVSWRSVMRWFDAYRDGGVDALLTRKKGRGRAPMLDEAKCDALRAAVSAQGFRRAADALEWTKKNLKVEASLSSMYRYLGKSSRG